MDTLIFILAALGIYAALLAIDWHLWIQKCRRAREETDASGRG